MAQLLILTDEEYDNLLSRMNREDSVIVRRSTLEKLGINEELAYEKAETYSFGGEPDACIDFAGGTSHLFWDYVKEEN